MSLGLWLAFLFALILPLHPLVGMGMVLVLLAWTVLASVSARRLPLLTRKDLVFATLALASLVPVLLDPSQATVWGRIILYPWLITLAFQNLRFREVDVWRLLAILYVTSLGTAAVMLFQVEPGQFDFSWSRLSSVERQEGFYFTGDRRIGPNIAAYSSAAAILLALVRLRFRRGLVALNVAAIAGPSVFLVAAGGRNALVAIVLCLTIFVFYSPQGYKPRRTVAAAALRVSMAALAVMLGGLMLAQMVLANRSAAMVERFESVLSPIRDQNVQFRMAYWAIASEMAQERPQGWGYGEFQERYGISTHNEILGHLVGGGWVAAAAFVLLMGILWWHVLRMRRSTVKADAVRFLALCLLTTACLAMVTENVTLSLSSTFMPLFWVVIGLAWGIERRTPADRLPSDGRRRNTTAPPAGSPTPRRGVTRHPYPSIP